MKIILSVIALTIFISCNKEETKSTTKVQPANKQDCFCTKEFMPVCGIDNVTYGNSCEAKCANVTKFTEGACSNN